MNKIVQGILVYNDAKFLKHALNLADVVDKIVIVEGGIAGYCTPGAITDGRYPSWIDESTHMIIEQYALQHPNKVLHISKSSPWVSMEQQKQALLDCVDVGDWVLVNDSDEVYLPQNIVDVRQLMEKYPNILEFVPTFLYFNCYGNLLRKPYPEGGANPHHQRLFKKRAGYHYSHHPIVTDRDNRNTVFDQYYADKRAIIKDWYVWHYSLCRDPMYTLLKEYWMFTEKRFNIGLSPAEAMERAIAQHYDRKTVTSKDIVEYTGMHPYTITEADVPILDTPIKLDNYKTLTAYNLNKDNYHSICHPGIPKPKLIYKGEMIC